FPLRALLAGLALCCGLGQLWMARLGHQFEHRHKAGLCVWCGYDLRASQTRCPECGGDFWAPQPPAEPEPARWAFLALPTAILCVLLIPIGLRIAGRDLPSISEPPPSLHGGDTSDTNFIGQSGKYALLNAFILLLLIYVAKRYLTNSRRAAGWSAL